MCLCIAGSYEHCSVCKDAPQRQTGGITARFAKEKSAVASEDAGGGELATSKFLISDSESNSLLLSPTIRKI